MLGMIFELCECWELGSGELVRGGGGGINKREEMRSSRKVCMTMVYLRLIYSTASHWLHINMITTLVPQPYYINCGYTGAYFHSFPFLFLRVRSNIFMHYCVRLPLLHILILYLPNCT